MRSSAYTTILSNPNLPSLPVVALEILELAAREDLDLRTMEKTIERDQAIAVRILRTVNSSYYGLSKPCGSIRQAVALLGVQTVRSLVLGFSLETTLSGISENEVSFDFLKYWRRAFYSASAARLLADKVSSVDSEETFITALMQDMGMVALWRIHSDKYLQIVDMAEMKHGDLVSIEQRILDINHAELGSEMARRWRFPELIANAISRHHDDVEDINERDVFSRVVRLAGIASDMLDADESTSAQKMKVFEQKSADWFGIESADAIALLGTISTEAKKMSKALEIEVGHMPDADQVLARASEMLAVLPHTGEEEKQQAAPKIDPVTGLPNREELISDLEMSYQGAQAMTGCLSGVNLGLLLLGIDDVRGINERFGDEAGDAALAHVADTGLGILTGLSGAVGIYRFVGAEIAIILRGFEESDALEVAEEIRASLARRPVRVEGRSGEGDFTTVSVTVGVGVYDPKKHGSNKETPDALLRSAMCAVTSGRRTGGDCVVLDGDDELSSLRMNNVA